MKKLNLKLCTLILSIAVLNTGCKEEKLALIDSYQDVNFFAKNIVALEDGGSIVATGYENVLRLNDNEIDDSNKVVWEKKIPVLRIETIERDGKDFILAGERQVVDDSSKVTAEYLKCVKLSENGDILWELKDTVLQKVEVYDLVALENGTFGVVGIVRKVTTDTLSYSHPFVLKINSQGEVLWRKIFKEMEPTDGLFKASKTSKGGIMMVCNSYYDTGLLVHLLEIDNAGNIISTTKHKMEDIFGADEMGYDYILISDLNLISNSNEEYIVILKQRTRTWTIKFDKNSEIVWNKELVSKKFFAIKNIATINDNLLVATATSKKNHDDYNYLCLVGFNENMEVLWHHESKTTHKNSAYAITKGFNGDIFVTVGDKMSDSLLSNSLRKEDFSERYTKKSFNPYSGGYLSELTVNHYQLK